MKTINSPSVKIVIGKVSITRSGLTKVLSIPSTTAAISAPVRPSIDIPIGSFATKSNARAVMAIRVSNFIIMLYHKNKRCTDVEYCNPSHPKTSLRARRRGNPRIY